MIMRVHTSNVFFDFEQLLEKIIDPDRVTSWEDQKFQITSSPAKVECQNVRIIYLNCMLLAYYIFF